MDIFPNLYAWKEKPSYIQPHKPQLPKLHRGHTTPIINMFQLQLLILLALRMEIYPGDGPHDLVEADVVEALKAGS